MNSEADHRVDHICIYDFLQGSRRAFDKKNLKSRIFNLSRGKAYTFKKMARMVEDFTGLKITLGPGLLKYYETVGAALIVQRAQSE